MSKLKKYLDSIPNGLVDYEQNKAHRLIVNEDGVNYEELGEKIDYSKWVAYIVIGLGAAFLLIVNLLR